MSANTTQIFLVKNNLIDIGLTVREITIYSATCSSGNGLSPKCCNKLQNAVVMMPKISFNTVHFCLLYIELPSPFFWCIVPVILIHY